jgi:hypothetical protein
LSLSLSLPKTQKPTRPTPMAYHQMKKKRDKPCDRRCSGYLAILPLCHDWTGVVALSFPFPPYKYQGTKKRTDEEKKRKGRRRKTEKKEKKEERNIREKEEERNMGEQSKERKKKKNE